MVQLRILSGKMAGTVWVARRFPVRIGRSVASDLRLEEAGVWDDHLLLQFHRDEGFLLSVQPDALASVNGEQVREAVLRNGDLIELGALKLQFWLAEMRQTSSRVRDALVWTGITAVFLAQLGLIYWLLQ